MRRTGPRLAAELSRARPAVPGGRRRWRDRRIRLRRPVAPQARLPRHRRKLDLHRAWSHRAGHRAAAADRAAHGVRGGRSSPDHRGHRRFRVGGIGRLARVVRFRATRGGSPTSVSSTAAGSARCSCSARSADERLSLAPDRGSALFFTAAGLRPIEELTDQLPLPLADLVEMLVERVLADGLGREVQVLDLIELGGRCFRHKPRRRRGRRHGS